MSVPSNLLDQALGLHGGPGSAPSLPPGQFILIEDCVETSGAFVLHHLMKRALSTPGPRGGGALLFVALAHPFFHYDRVLKKLGCNLSAQRDNNNLHFFDMLKLEPQEAGQAGDATENMFVQLFDKIQKAVGVYCSAEYNTRCLTLVVDDISLLEIAARGSTKLVLDFLHYCTTLTSEVDCSIVVLNHIDVYPTIEAPGLLPHLEYLADIIIRAEPLITGLAADVHGQLTIINKGSSGEYGDTRSKAHNFHFKVKENNVDYFFPGRQA